jgi:hypothetical protein
MFPPIPRSPRFAVSVSRLIRFLCGARAPFRCSAIVTKISRRVMDLAAARATFRLPHTRAAERSLPCLLRLGCLVPEDSAGQNASGLRLCLQLPSIEIVVCRPHPLSMVIAPRRRGSLLPGLSLRVPMRASGPARRRPATNLPAREVCLPTVPLRTRSAKPATCPSLLSTRAGLVVVAAPSRPALSVPCLPPKPAKSLRPQKARLPLIPSLRRFSRARRPILRPLQFALRRPTMMTRGSALAPRRWRRLSSRQSPSS